MPARIVTPLGGRSVAFLSQSKPVVNRCVVVWDRVFTEDDLCGNFFAQARHCSVNIGTMAVNVDAVGQSSNFYQFPQRNTRALGMLFEADFFGRIVKIRLYQDFHERNIPVFAVLHKDNSWMTRKGYTIPEAFFKNLMQLKYFVSQSSVVTLGSAYQLFYNSRNEFICDVLERTIGPRRNLCRVWLQMKKGLPSVFANPKNQLEYINVFPMENETFPNRSVIGATNQVGTDTIDLRRFLQWRAVISKTKLGRELIRWVH